MPKKIMVVDDDPYIVDYLVNVFEDHGYLTCRASDGVSAYDVAMAEKPDLITLDLEMPNEWGPRFYRRLTLEEQFSDIPVIVISGLPGIHMAIKRAVATIKKPFDPTEVIEIVRKALGDTADLG
ncbi:DVU0259 family response regulator domain-containing protein [Maridesulfovibrio hydrothermalis]|uniref:Response regulator receiver protein n=1 Tax=Maridesulfovibrio hydrothermalis AM13 = DSM 14728 TaxID=1121451 RepID=L0RBV7_9BACT|nr:response regulator [Maridesulfovibrio hydrothermalis]CCO23707.1 Response regulator receiver protein [Maridesulfovibrio hydrothermalis AM13 = DSM 14728]